MQQRSTTLLLLAVVLAVVVTGGVYFFFAPAEIPEETPIVVEEISEPEPEVVYPIVTQVGSSVEGRPIESYTFGDGDTHLLFVGGIHGGYEWNSSLLAFEFIDYFTENLDAIPTHLTLTIIPNANPDGLFLVTGTNGRFALADVPDPSTRVPEGRFNANEVDLNRNFDCKWQPESTWRGNVVSAGTSAFSEPEAVAIRDWVLANQPTAAVFWHSQANNVYASECEAGVLPETLEIMGAYADAASYGAVASFDAYPVSGDVEGWLASIGTPAITVELETFSSIEWERNKRGLDALLSFYSNDSLAR